MKIFVDLLPVLLFFLAYKWKGVLFATGVLVVATVVQMSVLWLVRRKLETAHVVTLVAVVFLGGATLILHDALFIKWKPTIVNLLLAGAFLGSRWIGQRTLVERMMGAHLTLPTDTWRRLNLAWIAFFVFCAGLNLVVAYRFSEAAWVNFKLFGLTALSLLFVMGQMVALRQHLAGEPAPAAK